MHLLDKKTVSTDLARQKKLQIDEGVKLATKVDVLRETVLKEEGNLKRFRGETIQFVQKEIDEKIQERDLLEKGNVFLREERIRLSAPIDLTEAWEEVKTGKTEISSWKESLSEKEVRMIARESDVVEGEQSLTKRTETITRKEKLTERTLAGAQDKFEKASITLEKAHEEGSKLVNDAIHREQLVTLRESDATVKEEALLEQEKAAAAHELDLSNRELALKDRYETFVKAQHYINSKK